MKETKRALRRHQESRVYARRLRKYANSISRLIEKDGTEIDHPTSDDLRRSNRFYYLKNVSTVCSCDLCRIGKYDRNAQHRADRDALETCW